MSMFTKAFNPIKSTLTKAAPELRGAALSGLIGGAAGAEMGATLGGIYGMFSEDTTFFGGMWSGLKTGAAIGAGLGTGGYAAARGWKAYQARRMAGKIPTP